ncbi:glycosyltransferase family 2 protein [Paracoccus sp. (in: a-proteobacteria)]|uniref:glycosyltransferase family 2 protein n=1 Tax=Paracoccus sp. TaxID=267 RepID=UPI0026DF390E|nr:glycosyltransferase family 2 protein [Paracoccus sp. (in: a-proteobacteria)]MDO5371392.1 glycosyltransferase family 2 protein [Paracoccus sp. (in: a-proteobacteria)]
MIKDPLTSLPRVTVLMALYQGERFVTPQLDSIAGQTGVDWQLIVGDDQSTDDGPRLVREFSAKYPGQVKFQLAPGNGAAENFRDLLYAAQIGEYVALADQDDVWHPEKLIRAMTALATQPAERPAIYCSRVTTCDEALAPLSLSRLPRRPPSFRHALVQNMVQGNTLLMNPAALALMRSAGRLAGPVVMHDWWIYQMVSGAGGTVIYDPWPSLNYRQHRGNVVGGNTGARSRLASLTRMLRGQHAEWSRQNLAALSACAALLTPENRRLLEHFRSLIEGSPTERLSAMRQATFYRQGRISQAALWMAAALGRV